MADKSLVRILREGGIDEWNLHSLKRRETDPGWQADLSGVDLKGTNLNRANLSHANLEAANLSDASLCFANLRGASLRGARLSRTTIYNSIMAKADLSYSTLIHCKICQLDLRGVEGLERIRHLGPSSIGIDSLHASEGEIPEVFMRGCGVPEYFIEYSRSLTRSPINFYSCFISYSHADKEFARRLHDGLQGRGIRCWLDVHELLPGDAVQDQIDRGIRLWDKVLVCCSEASLGFSAWVDIEVEKAMQKEAKLQKKRGRRVHALIPLNLDNYLFDSWKSGMASVLKGRLAADFRGWEKDNAKFEEQFERVVRALQTGDSGREAPPPSKL